MMMSKPRPAAKVAPAESGEDTKKKSPQDAVKDLERRLAALGGANGGAEAKVAEPAPAPDPSPPAFAAPASGNSVKGGKNALLARIMAAQERAKQGQSNTADSGGTESTQNGAIDLLSDDAPPAFDAASLPPPPAAAAEEAPPSFDAVETTVMEQVHKAVPPPSMDPPPTMQAPIAPSAPAFEDLLESRHVATNNPLDGITHVVPPPPAPPAVQDEFTGFEGLSEEERVALMEEQRQIMEQIEKEKAGNAAAVAAASADAFEQRSSAAAIQAIGNTAQRSATTVNLGSGQEVTLHGQEHTKQAIQAGTAMMMQCLNCQNLMQVTDNATLMYCPVCGTVSPVERETVAMSRQEAIQMAADRQMAEQLQNEEYKKAERPARTERPSPKPASQSQSSSGSWWDWITGSSTETATQPSAAADALPHERPQTTRPLERGEVGVSLPPGAGGLSSATTGAEDVPFSNSRREEPRNTARIAEQKPLFSCVADSISTAATSLTSALNTQTLQEDQEGNIHGVDATSLLAVTKASRETQD